MQRSNSHYQKGTPPRQNQQLEFVPVVQVLREAYRLWQASLPHIAKVKRLTIVARIDTVLLDALQSAFLAGYAEGERKFTSVEKSQLHLDMAKFLLLIAWDTGAITNGQHMDISTKLVEASKMLAGWKKYLEKKTPVL